PPGDLWYDPESPQARTPRPSAGDALVSKARIIPHWIHQGNRFWYRNDLGKGKREFILVDAENGTREPAFDHEKLAGALSRATRNEDTSADNLPFDAIDIAEDLKSVRFRVGETTWRWNFGAFECERSDSPLPSTPPEPATSPDRARQSRRSPNPGDRSSPSE